MCVGGAGRQGVGGVRACGWLPSMRRPAACCDPRTRLPAAAAGPLSPHRSPPFPRRARTGHKLAGVGVGGDAHLLPSLQRRRRPAGDALVERGGQVVCGRVWGGAGEGASSWWGTTCCTRRIAGCAPPPPRAHQRSGCRTSWRWRPPSRRPAGCRSGTALHTRGAGGWWLERPRGGPSAHAALRGAPCVAPAPPHPSAAGRQRSWRPAAPPAAAAGGPAWWLVCGGSCGAGGARSGACISHPAVAGTLRRQRPPPRAAPQVAVGASAARAPVGNGRVCGGNHARGCGWWCCCSEEASGGRAGGAARTKPVGGRSTRFIISWWCSLSGPISAHTAPPRPSHDPVAPSWRPWDGGRTRGMFAVMRRGWGAGDRARGEGVGCACC